MSNYTPEKMELRCCFNELAENQMKTPDTKAAKTEIQLKRLKIFVPPEIQRLIAENLIDHDFDLMIKLQEEEPVLITKGIPNCAQLAGVNRAFAETIQQSLQKHFTGQINISYIGAHSMVSLTIDDFSNQQTASVEPTSTLELALSLKPLSTHRLFTKTKPLLLTFITDQ